MSDFRRVGQVMEARRVALADGGCVPRPKDVPHVPQVPNDTHVPNAASKSAVPSDRFSGDSELDAFVATLESGGVADLPFQRAVRLAARYQQEIKNEDREDWEDPLWHFSRVISGHPDMRAMDADSAFEKVDRALSDIGLRWSDFDDVDSDSAPMDFVLAWDGIKVPPGSSPLQAAQRLATSDPLLEEGHVPPNRPASYLTFLNCAAWLSIICGGQFYLGERSAGSFVDASRMTGNRHLKLAVRDGFLEVVESHGPNTRVRRATEYVFRIDHLPLGAISRAEEIVNRDRLREACSATTNFRSGGTT